MAKSMKASLKMIRSMDMVSIHGQMEEISKAGGMKANNMVLVFIKNKIQVRLNLDYGKWEKD